MRLRTVPLLFALAVSAVAPMAVAMPVPVSRDEGRFLEITSPMKAASSMPARVASVGASLLGSPYEAHTLDGWKGDREPLVAKLDAFDCVTFVETAVAAARASYGKRPDWRRFQSELEHLRYRDGKRGDYASRLHYFSEWIADNERRGLVLDLTASLGGELDDRPLRFMTSHRQAYAKLADDRTYREVLATESELATSPRYVIPKAKVAAILPMLQSGDIVAIATNIEGLDVVHTGLIYRQPDGSVHLLHAPEPGTKVQVSEKPLVEYLQTYKVYTGILVARPLAPANPAP